MKIMTSKEYIKEKLPLLKKRVNKIKSLGITPKLVVFLIGDNKASELYVNKKKTLAEEVGIDFKIIKKDENITQNEFFSLLETEKNDDANHGIFIQLPLPKNLKNIDTSNLIQKEKDVDGFGNNSVIRLYNKHGIAHLPCTPKGIMSLLHFYQIDPEGKDVLIIGRSKIVGLPLFHLLNNENATVTLAHSKTKDLKKHTLNADIIISAVGMRNLITKEMVREDKSQIIIDVGTNFTEDNKPCGDTDFNEIKENLLAITPVPGGIGPMTVFSLIENLVDACEYQIKEKK